MAEDLLVEYVMEDHAFGPTNVRAYFTEDELTLHKSRLLQIDSFVE